MPHSKKLVKAHQQNSKDKNDQNDPHIENHSENQKQEKDQFSKIYPNHHHQPHQNLNINKKITKSSIQKENKIKNKTLQNHKNQSSDESILNQGDHHDILKISKKSLEANTKLNKQKKNKSQKISKYNQSSDYEFDQSQIDSQRQMQNSISSENNDRQKDATRKSKKKIVTDKKNHHQSKPEKDKIKSSCNNSDDSQIQRSQRQGNQEEDQQISEEQSQPVVPALKQMKFRQKRGTKMKDLMQGKFKIDKNNFVDKKVNDYLGFKVKPKQKIHNQKNKKQKGEKKKGKKQEDSQELVYDFGVSDSDDLQDYVQSSSGRDQFDSDFDQTQSYPGKRGRKKGTKSKKRSKGRGRPRTTTKSQPIQQDIKQPKKRGRPRKFIIGQDGSQIYVQQRVSKKQGRGRPKKYLALNNTDSWLNDEKSKKQKNQKDNLQKVEIKEKMINQDQDVFDQQIQINIQPSRQKGKVNNKNNFNIQKQALQIVKKDRKGQNVEIMKEIIQQQLIRDN